MMRKPSPLLPGTIISRATALPGQDFLPIIYSPEAPSLGAFVFLLFLLAFSLLSCNLDPDPGERYALVYGVATYVEPGNQLEYSDDDAIAVESLLKERGYPEGNVITRVDAAATKDQIEEDINSLVKRAKEDSLLVFFFSGHGLQVEDSDGTTHESIFLYHPSNTFLGKLKDDELMRLLQKIPSKRKVILIDACNSGGFIGDFPGVDGIPPDYQGSRVDYLKAARKAFVKYFANVEAGDIPYTEAVVIAAAGAPELSFEAKTDFNGNPVNHGIFTYYLLQATRHADRNRDGWITALELYRYTQDRIEKDWNKYLSSGEMFLPRISGGPLDLVIF